MIKARKSHKSLIIIAIISISIITLFYYIDRRLTPSILSIGESSYKSRAMEIMQETTYDVYSKNTNYEDFIKIEKDDAGNIVLLRADVVTMSAVAGKAAIECTQKLKEVGKEGIDIPILFIARNNLTGYTGPCAKVKMVPISRVEIKYISDFKAAGINQTKHTISIILTAKMRIVLPTSGRDIEVVNQIPICETVIVGKIPNTNLQLGK